jgi:hypothetical protein
MLWLLSELGMRPLASILATALAVWNPYRGEVWTSLTLAEGVAMPYAILSLVFAVRGSRSLRPWPWDIGGALCMLAALGCKNTFAAMIPVQCLLRILAGGLDLRTGLRRHGLSACLLAMTLLMPVTHFVVFKLNWRPGQYPTDGAGLAQLVRMLRAVAGAESVDFMGAGLAVALLALAVDRYRNGTLERRTNAWANLLAGFAPIWRKYRIACTAGITLLVLGIGMYLPIGAVSGRYSMPAVWGMDLCIAALVSCLAEVTRVSWRRAAHLALFLGLATVALANLGKQQKFAARATVLWETLEYVDTRQPAMLALPGRRGRNSIERKGFTFAGIFTPVVVTISQCDCLIAREERSSEGRFQRFLRIPI